MKNTMQQLEKLVHDIKSIGVVTTRDNANVGSNFSAKLLQIASTANKTIQLMDMPEDIAAAHNSGRIHLHDADSYNLTINCLNIDTGRALKNGFNTGYGTINKPKRIESAAELSCILLQSTQNDMFGGQSHADLDNDLAEYAYSTEQELLEEMMLDYSEEEGFKPSVSWIARRINEKLEKAVRQACQTIVYNLNSMHSRAGSQVPFSSINLGIPKNKYAALVCKCLLEEYNKGLGKGEQPIFPNIIFRVKEGVNREPGDPYYYLYQLACKVASNRMNPTFVNCDASFELPNYMLGILPTRMGCRTRVQEDINGVDTPLSRGNIAPVSINLPQIAIETMIKIGKENIATTDTEVIISYFFKELDETLALCERSLLHRYNTLKQLKGRDLPFLVSENLIAGAEEVDPDDSIEPILRHGTWGIGFIGLAETLTCLTGMHHGEATEALHLGFETIERIRTFCDFLKVKYKLNFTCYATPAEGLSNRFTDIDKAKYGEIPGVTDREFYTNSYHVPVDYPCGIKEKLEIEAPFHELCNAGHISYVELDNAPLGDDNLVERVITHAFTNTDAGYIGVNFGIRYCRECGENHVKGNLCPKCNSSSIQGIHRVTGYLSLDERFGNGKKAEVKARKSNK